MKSLHKNNHGFAHIGLMLLAIIVIAAVGGVGYYVATKNKNPKASTNNNVATQDQQKQSNNQLTAENGISVMTADKKAQFYLPKTWELLDKVDGGNKCGFVDGDSAGDTCLLSASFKPSVLDEQTPYIWYVKIYKSQQTPKDWTETYVGMSCVLTNTQSEAKVSGYNSLYAKFDNNSCSGSDFYVISNGQYVAYFEDQGRDKTKTTVDTTVYDNDFKNIVNSIKFND